MCYGVDMRSVLSFKRINWNISSAFGTLATEYDMWCESILASSKIFLINQNRKPHFDSKMLLDDLL